MKVLTVLYAMVLILYDSYGNNMSMSRPNIVLILVDDLGWNDVGFNNPDIISPNIDQLAKTGVILNQSYVQPLCTPSRSAIMTGIYPFRLGLSHLVILWKQDVCGPPQDKIFLPEILKQNGYSTHLVGKWHLGFCNWKCTPTHRGFDSFYGYYQGEDDYYSKMSLEGYDFRDGDAVDTSGIGIHSSYLYRNRIEQIINSHNTSNPLFMYVASQEVHSPLKVPREYYDLYPNIQDEARRNVSALMTAMDTTIGALVQALKKKGLYDNTLIVFSADNGGFITSGGNNFPLRGGKVSIFEGGTRAAAFVHGPMFEKIGVRYDGLIHIVDWYPTLIEAAGLDAKVSDLDGISQWKNLLNLSPSNRRELVYNLDYSSDPVQGQSAIRVGDYKLILGYPGLFHDWYDPARVSEWGPTLTYQRKVINVTGRINKTVMDDGVFRLDPTKDYRYLFNLRDDPEERNNIYDKKPEIVQRMTERLEYYKTLYVTPNFPPDNPNSDPARWGGVWTPGWC